MTDAPSHQPAPDKNRRAVVLIYLLYFFGFVTGITALAGVAIAHAKSGEMDTLYQSHLDYQIRTFWYGLATIIVGSILSLVLVGYLVLLWWTLWTLVRCIKGIVAANDGVAIENSRTWLW